MVWESIFTCRHFSVLRQGFCLHFHYISTLLSDAYILSPIWWLGFNLLTHSAHSPRCPVPHRESERGYITAHESRQNEMHSRRFQMVLIYGRGLRIQKKKCIKCNLITLFDAEFMSSQTVSGWVTDFKNRTCYRLQICNTKTCISNNKIFLSFFLSFSVPGGEKLQKINGKSGTDSFRCVCI